jgi:ATPase subunit of ABC transporter with duplicated ATPase domains
MPASITLSDLTWSASDAPPLFSHLSLSFGPVRTGLVGRNGVGKTTLLQLIAGDLRPRAGKVSVSGTLGVLRQTVRVHPAETVADLFGVTAALGTLRRAERGEAAVDELADADWTLETRVAAALGRVGLDTPPEAPLAALSGGQRTRAGLAALVFAEPDFLLLDEPTNNLDRDGRGAVIDLLAGWRSGAVVVSHDRELLETVDAVVELTALGATRYGGNWSAYRALKAQELEAARHDLAVAEKRVADVAHSAQLRAERQARRSGAGKRKGAAGGTPRIVLGGMKDRSEDTSGENARLADRLREQALDAAAAARGRIETLKPLTVRLPPTNLPAGKTVLKIDAVTAGYEPGRPVVQDLSLLVTGPERVAVTGPNGSGKTTLLALVTGQLSPWAGTVQVMTDFVALDQRVSLLDPAASVRDNFRRLNPWADEPACRAALARFLFRADTALQPAGTLSGGQLLRAGLACVLGRAAPPPFLVLDEPTNHLDIDSIEAVEAGLRAYDGALLVVSHDETFLKAVGVDRRVELQARAGDGRSGEVG